MKSSGTGCIYCGRLRTADAQRLDPKAAAATMHAAGLSPLDPYPGSQAPWRSRCSTCNREVRPSYATVRSGGGCRFCATKGIDLTAPAIIYVVTSDAFNAHKVGIGAMSRVRLSIHERWGWEVFKTAILATGEDAFEVERSVLSWLREDLGLRQGVARGLMPQSGETETVSADDISLPDLWAGVQAAIAAFKRPQPPASSNGSQRTV